MNQPAAGYPPVFDGHNDTVNRLKRTGESFFERNATGHLDLPRARAGRLGGGFCAVYISDPPPPGSPPPARGAEFTRETLERVLAAYADESRWPEPMGPEYARSQAVD